MIPIDRVQDCTTKISLLGRMLGYGRVEVDAGGARRALRCSTTFRTRRCFLPRPGLHAVGEASGRRRAGGTVCDAGQSEWPRLLSARARRLHGLGQERGGRGLWRERAKAPFHDLDRMVELEAGMSIPEIFASGGEGAGSASRGAHAASSARTRRGRSARGGTLIADESWHLVASTVSTVYLEVPFDVIWEIKAVTGSAARLGTIARRRSSSRYERRRGLATGAGDASGRRHPPHRRGGGRGGQAVVRLILDSSAGSYPVIIGSNIQRDVVATPAWTLAGLDHHRLQRQTVGGQGRQDDKAVWLEDGDRAIPGGERSNP